MPDKLQNPSDNEYTQRPAPVEQKERQRQNDHWNADTVRQPVQWVLMFGFVVSYEILGHKITADFQLPIADLSTKPSSKGLTGIGNPQPSAHYLNKNIHRPATNHTFFASLVGGQ